MMVEMVCVCVMASWGALRLLIDCGLFDRFATLPLTLAPGRPGQARSYDEKFDVV